MRFQAKVAVATLVLALGCTPVPAQQGASENPPPPPQSMPAGRGPGGPGRQAGGMRGWAGRGRERGFADRGRDRRRGGEMGFGLGGFGLDGPLVRAERALRDPQIRQQLGISDQQASKLEQDITTFRKAQIQNRANLEIQRIDLQNLLAADNPDRAAVDSKLQQVGAAQQALEKSAVDFAVTLKQEIPPEQRQKIRQFLGERRGEFGRVGGTERSFRRAQKSGPQGSQPNAPAPPNPQTGAPPTNHQ
jgi:Spy/CpxP family protein refolding chaperone